MNASLSVDPEIRNASVVPRRWVNRSTLLLTGVLVLSTVIITRGIRRGEFDYNVDEAQHAVTGLFVADAFRDLPLRHPIQYAYRYYAQYPAVAIVHWPPLFYIAEGLSFLLLGSSALAARLTVLLFALLLLYQWFRLVEDLQDSYTAAVSTAILALLPLLLLFEKTVMLEVPSLALAVAAIRSWIKYLNEGTKRSLYSFAIWFSAAFLCKQTSVYLFPFCFLTLVVTRKWKLMFRSEGVWSALIFVILAGPFYVLMLVSHGRAVAHDLSTHQAWGWERLTGYFRELPFVSTPLVLGLGVLGLLLCRRWNRRGQAALMVCWMFAGYATFTFFGQKAARFTIYWLPPLVYFAAGLLTQFFRLPRIRLAMRGLTLLTVAVLTVRAWGYERPHIEGYRDAAAWLVNTYHSGVVLFDGRIPGNFVFYMRALDSRRQFLVLRKSLYASDIKEDETSEELIHSREGLLDLFQRDGIRFVVVLDPPVLHFSAQYVLHETLRDGRFRPIGRFPVSGNEPEWQGRSLLVYENKQWAPPVDRVLTIRMLTLDHDIVVPLDDFDFVSGPATTVRPQQR